MIRTLSLVLDEKGYESLTLMQGEAIDIDAFTSKFHDSEQIRNKFQKEIDAYLESKKNYIASFKRNTRGRIVILECHNIANQAVYVPKRVIYKKYLVAFDTMLKDEATMKRFLTLEGKFINEKKIASNITGFIKYKISRGTNFKVRSQVDFLRSEIKKLKPYFYDNLRSIAKAYEEECKVRKNLKTIDEMFKDYLEEQRLKKEEKEKQKEVKQEQSQTRPTLTHEENEQIKIGDNSYNSEELDLDKLSLYDDEDIIGMRPDGLGPKR